jgi:glycerol-3-phosphate dehydrogenase
MGARTVDRAAELLISQGVAVSSSPTRERPFPGAPGIPMEAFIRDLGARAGSLCPGLDERTVRHLAWRYGTKAADVLRLAATDPDLGRPLCAGLPDIEAEVVFAARAEDARSLCDVLIRRTHLFWQAPGQGEACLERASRLLAGELDRDEPRRREDIACYERELARSRRFMTPPTPSR